MAFSFFRLVLSETLHDEYVAVVQGKVLHGTYRVVGTAACRGKIDAHNIWLGFTKKGVPAWTCSCRASTKICPHVIAIAREWDRSRAVPDPTEKDARYLCQR